MAAARWVGFAFVAGGLLAALYGLLLIAYEGDVEGTEPVFQIGGREVDADIVGGVVSLLGVGAVVVGALLLRGRSRA
jgi:ABC-type branched-subunit amino acid transport system permease subunit